MTWRRPGYHYVPDYYGRSSHKQRDLRSLPTFGALADEVTGHGRTLLYYDRLFTIYQSIVSLKRTFDVWPTEVNVVEVGVYRGGTTYFIAELVERLGLQNVRLRCFDTFEGHPAEDVREAVDGPQKPRSFSDIDYSDVKTYLRRFDTVEIHKGRFQETAQVLEHQTIHFAHIDLDIFEPTAFALKFIDQRLVEGGAMIVDDYAFISCPGVTKAVDEFAQHRPNYFMLLSLTGQCVLVKVRNSTAANW